MNIVDLHVHSTKSDGSFTPKELVDYAIEKGLSAFALTDHDCVDGLDEAIEYAKGKKIEVIPGIELSTEYEGRDIHIVGLYIDYKSQVFQNLISDFVTSRINRNKKMCQNLQDEGLDITYEELLNRFPDSVITRSHYARFLMEKGYISSMKVAFDKYIGDHCSCFVPREKVTPMQAVKLILEANGIPILAHPILYHMSQKKLDSLVHELKDMGLMGIEAIYSTYSPSEEREIRKLASKYHLLISGGSDFHGINKPGLDLAVGYGKLFIPEEILLKMKETRKNFLFSDLDGTLLCDNCTISPTMKQALDSLIQKGHKLVLSSGRPLASMLHLTKKLNLDYPNLLLIAFNGSLVYDLQSNSILMETKISPEDIQYIAKEAKKQGIHCQGYTSTHIVTASNDPELAYYRQKIDLDVNITETMEGFVEALKNGSYKLLCIELNNPEKLISFRNSIIDHCCNRLQLIFSNKNYLEIVPMEAGKGNAVSFVRDYYHIPLSHTYAAGDAENDISMLKNSGHGIAVNNASESTKSAAEIVTKNDNNHDGLLEILESSFYN